MSVTPEPHSQSIGKLVLPLSPPAADQPSDYPPNGAVCQILT